MCSSQPLDQDPMAGQTSKVNITHGIIWLVRFTQRTVEIWRVNGWIGSTRIQRFGSSNLLHQPLPRGTIMAIESWTVEIWSRLPAIPCTHIYCKLISSSNQCSVNRKSQLFLHKPNFKPILTDLKVFGPPESKFDLRLSVWSLEVREINNFPNKHIKIHKIKYI